MQPRTMVCKQSRTVVLYREARPHVGVNEFLGVCESLRTEQHLKFYQKNSKQYIYFYNLFIASGLETKDKYLREAWQRKRATDLTCI